MYLTIRLLGIDILEFSTEPTSPALGEDDCSRDLSGGTTYASPMGFTAHMDKPHEVETPDRDW